MIDCPFQPGDLVTWRYTCPGGWGYRINVPARVVGFGRGRVKILAQLARGGEKAAFVKAENLSRGR